MKRTTNFPPAFWAILVLLLAAGRAGLRAQGPASQALSQPATATAPAIAFADDWVPVRIAGAAVANPVDVPSGVGARAVLAVADAAMQELWIDPGFWVRFPPPGSAGPGAKGVYLGVMMDAEATGKEGVAVSDVADGGPAQAAGIRPGDVILRIDGKPIADPAALRQALAGAKDGQTVKIQIRRDDKTLEIPVKLKGR